MSGEADPATLREAWGAVVGSPDLGAVEVRESLVETADAWLGALWESVGADADGVALVAVGSLGRRELVPGSDLDLVLVHDPARAKDAARLADALWYPIWDAKIGLDHAVRTVDEARRVAGDDLRVVLGLLDARHLAGDEDLTAGLRSAVLADWRKNARRRLPELRAAGEARAAEAGELAYLLEPHLRDARGGLRDVLAIRQAAAAWLVEAPGERVAEAYRWLLDVRTELHRCTERAGDRLVMQEQRPVAARLGVDVDELARRTSQAGRAVAYALDETWRRVDAGLQPARRLTVRRARGPELRPLADGVVAAGGEVTLARNADPGTDPVLGLRVAAAAAQHDLPIAPATLHRLAGAPDLPNPWPAGALGAFLALLEAGRPAVAVVEAFDQSEIWSRWLPEWEWVRFRPQHNPVHRFTVDRHLVETAAEAAGLARRVERPDLLVLGALFHDLGKGIPGEDHTDAGVRVTPPVLRRMGLPPPDVDVVTMLVRHHLLLPDTATRRDPDDPATVGLLVDAVGSHERLDLLHALTEADALAAGPAAWTPWKAGLVATLVARAHAAIGGAAVPADAEPVLGDTARMLVAGGQIDAAVEGGAAAARITVVAPDCPGLLWRWAAVMAVHRLEILAATANPVPGPGGRLMAVTVFDVRPRFGDLPDAGALRGDLRRAVADPASVADRVAGRERSARPDVWTRLAAPPRVLWFDDESADATIVEVRAHDSAGLLSRLARVLAEAGLDVSRARIQTLGAEAVDAFYVTGPDGRPVTDPDARRRLEPLLLAACGTAT